MTGIQIILDHLRAFFDISSCFRMSGSEKIARNLGKELRASRLFSPFLKQIITAVTALVRQPHDLPRTDFNFKRRFFSII
jgi:hypothetical protein